MSDDVAPNILGAQAHTGDNAKEHKGLQASISQLLDSVLSTADHCYEFCAPFG